MGVDTQFKELSNFRLPVRERLASSQKDEFKRKKEVEPQSGKQPRWGEKQVNLKIDCIKVLQKNNKFEGC